MNKKQIIVISGKQFSGKDTVANILLKTLKDFKRIALADAIKLEFGEQKGLTYNEIERNKPLYRAELIELGNKRRAEDPDYWIKRVIAEDGNLIVPDIRLKHELEVFRKAGAIAIRVESSREARASRGTLVKENDKTETDLDKIKNWDYVIENNADYETLEKATQKVAEDIEKSIYSSSK